MSSRVLIIILILGVLGSFMQYTLIMVGAMGRNRNNLSGYHP